MQEQLLIYENHQEQKRIISEIEARRLILNRLSMAGLEKTDIISITMSLETIEKFIFKKQLEENHALKTLTESGIKGLTADLSPELARLSFDLKAFYNYKMANRSQSKFSGLIFTDTWEVDEKELEAEFIRCRLKVYLEEEEAIQEYQKLEIIRDYLEEQQCPNNLVVSNYFLNLRFEPIGPSRFRIRHSYFKTSS